MLVKGQVRDPLSIRTRFVADVRINPAYISMLYEASRAKFARPLQEVQKAVIAKQEVISKLESF